MSAPKVLSLVRGDGSAVSVRWPDDADEEARKVLRDVLKECDRFIIIGIARTEDGGTRIQSYRASRGTRSSALELVGAIYSRLHDWMGEL